MPLRSLTELNPDERRAMSPDEEFPSPDRSKHMSSPGAYRPHHRKPFSDPLELLPKGLTKLYSLWVAHTYPFASIGRNVSFHYTSKVDRQRASRISLGKSSSLREYAWLNVADDDPTGEPLIVVDENCHIGFASIVSAKNGIHLERDVLVGQHVIIVDHNHGYEDILVPVLKQGITEGGTIRIGQGSWIGHGAAIICPRGELTIGRNCVVAVNSVVTRSIPDYSLVVGMPARVIRQYDPDSGAWLMGSKEARAARNRAAAVGSSAEHENS
jgi:acetyltransferase-like isoleucine patch superfamily enzyme